MSDLFKAQLAGIIRHGLTAGSALLVAHGVSQSDASGLAAAIDPQAVAGFLLATGSLIWSLLHKKAVNQSLVTAAQTGQTTATVKPSL